MPVSAPQADLCAAQRHRGSPHTVMLWGGTAFNFGKDVPRLEPTSTPPIAWPVSRARVRWAF